MPDTSTNQLGFLQGASLKRATNIGLEVEYEGATQNRRVTNVGLSVEYKGSPNYRRVTNISLSVEYKPLYRSSQDAYLNGNMAGSSSQAAYLAGQESALDNSPAFTQGQSTSSDSLPAYLEGTEIRSDTPAYSAGSSTASGQSSAFLNGLLEQPADSSQTAYLQGQDSTSAGQASYLAGVDTSTQATPSFLSGSSPASSSSPAWLSGQSSSTSNQPAYINGYSPGVSAIIAFMVGQDHQSSATPSFLVGGVISSVAAFAHGSLDTQGNQLGYLKGSAEQLASLPAFLHGLSALTAFQVSFLSGIVTKPFISWAELETPAPTTPASDSKPSYLQGQAETSANQPAFLAGQEPTSAAQIAYTSGQEQSTANLPAFISGSSSSTTNQASYLAGGVTGSQSAYLEGFSEGELSSQAAFLSGSTDTLTSAPAFLQSGIAKANQTAYTSGGKGTFPITIGTGRIVLARGAILITTSRGEKYAIFAESWFGDLVIYKYVDGLPLKVADIDTATIGNSNFSRAAAIDGNDKIHIIVSGNSQTTRDIAYRVFDTATDTWEGSWEEAATLTGDLFDNYGIKLTIDSNNKPHVTYVDIITYYQVRYIEKTGANWSAPVTLSANASQNYALFDMTMKASDDIDVWYFNDDINDACYIVKTSGSWGAEQTYVGTWIKYSEGLLQLIDADGNMRRYHSTDAGTYAALYENNSNTGVQHNDSGIVISANVLANYPRFRSMLYRHEDTGLWIACNDGSGWITHKIRSVSVSGLATEWAYNFENEADVIGFLYEVSSTIYYDETVPIVDSQTPAYTNGVVPKSNIPAFLKGNADASSSKPAYLFCGDIASISTPAFLEGEATQSSIPAFTEGSSFSSSKPAYLRGGIGSAQPVYLVSTGIGTTSKAAFAHGQINTNATNTAYAYGDIAPKSSQPAFVNSMQNSTKWSTSAFLQAEETQSINAYLSGLVIARDYIRIHSTEGVFQFKVLTEGYSDGELTSASTITKTIAGGLDASLDARYRMWRPTIRVYHGDLLDLERLYKLTEVMTYEDHFGIEHSVLLVGSLQKSLVGSSIEKLTSLFLVKPTFIEVQL